MGDSECKTANVKVSHNKLSLSGNQKENKDTEKCNVKSEGHTVEIGGHYLVQRCDNSWRKYHNHNDNHKS